MAAGEFGISSSTVMDITTLCNSVPWVMMQTDRPSRGFVDLNSMPRMAIKETPSLVAAAVRPIEDAG